jgi:hypothetical protein
VRAAFGHSSTLKSSWTFLGVAGFLIWGIPMGIMIAGIFAVLSLLPVWIFWS